MRKRYIFIILLLVSGLLLWAEGAKETGEETEGVVAKGEGPSWQWDTSPHTIDWFVAEDWYNVVWNTKVNLMHKKITEETGISVNINSGPPEKLNALIATDSLPDVVTMHRDLPQRPMLEEGEKLESLEKLIEQYAPTFNFPRAMADWYRNEKTGEWYGVFNYFSADEETLRIIGTNYLMVARSDIMDQLGIKPEDFNTLEGMFQALKKVKDAGVRYNGLEVFPYFTFTSAVDFAEYLGLKREDEKGNYVPPIMAPATLEAIKFYNRLYRAGLFSEEILVTDVAQNKEKCLNGQVFFQFASNVYEGYGALTDKDPKTVMVAVGPPSEGRDIYVTPACSTGWTATVITKNAKRKDRIIRFFEYLWEDRHQIEIIRGPEDIAWIMGEDGRIEWTPQYLEDIKANPAARTQKYVSGFDWLTNWLPIARSNPKPKTVAEQALENSGKYFRKYCYFNIYFSGIKPAGGTDESGIGAKIDEYWMQQEASMIMAESEDKLMEIYKETINNIEKIGYQKWYDVVNANFQKNKKKMGVEFAIAANRK